MCSSASNMLVTEMAVSSCLWGLIPSMLHFLKSAIIDLIFQEKDSKFHDINSDGDVISDLFCHVVVEGWQKETGTLDSHHNTMAHYLSNHSHHARGDGWMPKNRMQAIFRALKQPQRIRRWKVGKVNQPFYNTCVHCWLVTNCDATSALELNWQPL